MKKSELNNLKPITRDFLKSHYDKYPMDPMDPVVEQTTAKFQDIIAKVESCSGVSEIIQPLAFTSGEKEPWRIDENNWRLRQFFETSNNALSDAIPSIESYLKDKNVSNVDEEVKRLQTMCTSFNRFFDKVAEWQDKNVKKVEVMVNSFLPQDWRARLMQSQRAKSEKKNTQEIENLLKNGGTKAEKYDLLWDQQMRRRQQLVDFGNATGMYKFSLKFMGGVPQVLLDFVKTINHPDGPMEEMRCRYAPNLYLLRNLGCMMAQVILVLVHLLPSLEWNDADNSVRTILDILESGCDVMEIHLSLYLDSLWEVVDSSPFFVRSRQEVLVAKEESEFTRIDVKSGEQGTLDILPPRTGMKIGWEFTVVDKDIGFGVVTVENDEETVVIESAKMSASQGLIEGSIVTEEKKCYRLVFDNAYSYFRSKSVDVRVFDVDPPQPEEGCCEASEIEAAKVH
eukprot:TRINITY_DN5012_c0_g1_i5.p1 TRINITY_DN5012_c0_g1~~TRINITY_DN5012_c0_g1_i5.p1  ORF type:complete len:454 (+),score=93.37 TRINITY_DN5012_c0_g1_i5:62-1423(+)